MPKFDPNKPFEAVANKDSGKKKFDPSKPFEEVGGETSMMDAPLPFGTSPRGLIQGGLNALPTAGMIGGGIVGAGLGGGAGTLLAPGPGTITAGTAGAVGGAGLGSAMGESLKNLGEQYILGKDKTRADIYGKPAMGFLEGAANEAGGQSVNAGLKMAAESKMGKKVLEKAGKGAAYIASSLSGVPQKEIELYAKNADEINKLAKSNDYDSQEMADQLRQKFNTSIQGTKGDLNSQISKALESKGGTTVEIDPILEGLESAKAKINEKLRPEEIKELNGIISRVKSLGSNGKISLADAHDAKEYLQEIAKGTYQKDGQIFTVGDKASKAAKIGAAKARELVNKLAPEVAEANNSLSNLHDIEDLMNKNLLTEGKTGASLYAAGSGGNEANAKILKRLGQATGTDMLGDAEKLATARTFGKPALLPVDTTGKSLTRMGVAGVGGYLMGGLPGAAVGEVLASPAALKASINTTRGLVPIGSNPQLQGLLLRNYLKQKSQGLLDK